MTLILALACKDGMIFASDGQAVTTALAHNIPIGIRQDVSKINRLGEDKLWGFSGSEGIGLEIKNEIDRLERNKKDIVEKPLSDKILKERLKNIHSRITNAAIRRQLACNTPAERVERASLIFVGSNPNKILFISSNGGSQFCEQNGAFSIGDGNFYVESFLLNFRPRLKEFTVKEGCVIAYRAIRDAIKLSAGFAVSGYITGIIGEPIDIWTIKNKEEVKQKLPAEQKKLNNIVLSWKNAEINSFRLFLEKNKTFQQI
jgi:20S proteasome alpha/beta subunit